MRPRRPDTSAPSRRLRPLGAAFILALLVTRGVWAQPSPFDPNDSTQVIRPAPAHTDTVVTQAPARPPVLNPVLPDTVKAKPVPPLVPRVEAPLDRSAWITWTPRVSKLAIPRFLTGDAPFSPGEGWQLKYPLDARTVQLSVDPERGVVKTTLTAADVDLGQASEVPLTDYARELTGSSLRRAWVDQSLQRINHVPEEAATQSKQGPLQFTLPVVMPKTVTSILGKGAPSLNVSGSERISISGTSQWDNANVGNGVKRSLFPQLDMRQDLNIALNGSLGDKVHVDVAQNSANTLPLANRIGLRYQGYDDEILKQLDLGNTNLELPGTQYVSYSGRNEGLFGVKAAGRIGGTDLAVIASKMEGRSERKSFQGTAQEVVRTIDDLNYIKGKYFFMIRPADVMKTGATVDLATLKVWVDDINGSNNQGVRFGYAELDPTQAPGASPRILGAFDGLQPLTDYEVTSFYYGDQFPVLVLKVALTESQLLGITYDEVLPGGARRHVGSVPDCPVNSNVECDSIRVKVLQAPKDQLPANATNTDFYETDTSIAPFNITRDYQIKSFYDLQTSGIDPASLTLQVRRYNASLDESNDAINDNGEIVSYLQILGIDLFKDGGAGIAAPGADQLVDQFTYATYLDLQRGILFVPDLRPFDPRLPGRADHTPEDSLFFLPRVPNSDQTIPGLRKRVLWPQGLANPPGSTQPTTPVGLETNPNVYDKKNIQPTADRKYYIYAKFSGQDFSGQIYLGQTNLLEGSEVVAIDGIPLQRTVDYDIDYEAGIVTLKTARAREGRARMTIDYSFAPLFAQAGRTLVGSAIGYKGFDKSFGGAFIYESKGQQEARPRLGEEPSKTLITDLYGTVSLKPRGLTRLLDKLPGYSTTEESRIDINAEVGYSLPNPNTQNTVYLDDFEGNRDSYSAPMARGFWKWSSIPLVQEGAAFTPVKDDLTEMIWYNPYNTVKSGDLNPRLTANEGAQNSVSVLDLYIPKAPADSSRHNPHLWAGVTTTVEPDGADFSRLQYLELWINDWRDPDVRNNPNLKLHVDLGLVSEDQQRAPNAPPNGKLDTEDKNNDDKYDPRGADSTLWEDGGADGVVDGQEKERYDLSTATDVDLHGDDYGTAVDEQGNDVNFNDESKKIQRYDPFVYIKPTLTELSKNTTDNLSRVFTEDLNGDKVLQTTDSYVSYVLPLGDQQALSKFLIFAAESTLTNVVTPVAPNNGWRRYRIPLDASDTTRTVVNSGSLSNVKHLRVWLEGIDTFKGNETPPKIAPEGSGRQPLIEVGAIDVVGNRWRIAGSDSALQTVNGSIVARNVNNLDDRNIYTPPFDVETQTSGGSSTTQREQGLALEVTRLPYGSTATIFKTETQAEDYTRYGSIAFYNALFGFSDADSARFFVRIGYDDRNYYEYSRPIRGAATAPYTPTPWNDFRLKMTDFTDVKFNRPSSAVSDTVNRGEEQFVVVGAPTFTRVQQFSLGVFSQRTEPGLPMTGQVWIDDLRALDVDRSPGLANRFTMFTKFADLMTITTNWDRTDENFQRLGQERGSDINADRIAFSGNITPNKFFQSTGIQLPISFNYQNQSSTPRLFTGTDIVLGQADRQAEKTTGVDRGFGVALSKTGDRNPILKNTIGRVGLNFAFADRVGHSPTSIDSSRTLTGGGSYSIAPSEWLKIPMPLIRTRSGPQRLLLLPTTASISYSQSTQRSFLYKRDLTDPVGQYALQSDVYRKVALYQLAASWRPIPLGTYTINTTRNAYIPTVKPQRLFGINFGRQTNFQQRIDGRFGVKLTQFLNPQFDFASTYNELHTPDLSPDLSLGQFSNSSNAGLSLELPFTRLASSKPPQQVPVRVDSTGRDTLIVRHPGGGFSLPVGRLLSRLGNVSMRGTFSRTTGFSRYFGAPSVPYRLGIVRNPDTQWNGDEIASIYRGPQATDNAQRTYSGDASTQVLLFGRSNVRVRTTYTNTNQVYNSQVSNTTNLTFPDLDFDWGAMEKVLRLGKMFPQIGARSRFTRTDTKQGADLSNPTSVTRSQNFSPLFSLQGTTKGQATVQLSLDRTSSTRDDFTTRRATRNEGNTTVRSSISKTYLPGQKVPIFGGKGLKSSLTLQADAAYNKRTGSTEAFGAASSKTNNDRIDINASSTYAFSTFVNGTLGLGFSQARDLQLRDPQTNDPRKTRSLRLEAAATFRF